MHVSLRHIALFLCPNAIILYSVMSVLLTAFWAIKPLRRLERTCYANKEHWKGIHIYMSRKQPGINRFSQAIRFFRVSRLLLWTNPATPHLV